MKTNTVYYIIKLSNSAISRLELNVENKYSAISSISTDCY